MRKIERSNPYPLYLQLKEILREQISQKKSGDSLPSQQDLSRMHKVSEVTVKQALFELVQEGLLLRIRGAGTFVAGSPAIPSKEAQSHIDRNRAKKKISVDKKNNIGIGIRGIYNINHPYLNKVMKGITQFSGRYKYNLQIFTINNAFLQNVENIKNLKGLLLASHVETAMILKLKKEKFPFVWINQDLQGEDLYCVTVDYFFAAYNAVEYFYRRGHRKIGLITGPREGWGKLTFLPGYKFALERFEIAFNEKLTTADDYGEEGGYRAMKRLLSLKPTAIYVEEDMMAIGAMRAIEKRKLRIPEDIAIIGGGDMISVTNMKLLLTTFDYRLKEMGETAFKMLVKLMQGKKISEPKIKLKPKLIIRESSG